MVLALILFLVALPLSRGVVASSKVRAAVDFMSVILMQAHYAALMTAEDQAVVCDPARHCYSYNEKIYHLPDGVQFGFLRGVQGPPSGPTQEIAVPISFPKNTIIFSANGPVSAGTVYVVDRGQRCMYALTVAIGELFGVRKYRFATTWVALS